MPIIKRYPNRKLYDTTAKKYITLDGIAKMIREGEEVTVIDHNSDEDLTAVTLTQIIFEQEKKKSGFLPTSVLTSLVQSGGDTFNTLRRSLSIPLDLLQQVDKEIERRFQVLISKGEVAKEEGLRLRDKMLSLSMRSGSTPETEDAEIEDLLTRRGVPTRDEIDRLNLQIEVLTVQLDSLIVEKRTTDATVEAGNSSDSQQTSIDT